MVHGAVSKNKLLRKNKNQNLYFRCKHFPLPAGAKIRVDTFILLYKCTFCNNCGRCLSLQQLKETSVGT